MHRLLRDRIEDVWTYRLPQSIFDMTFICSSCVWSCVSVAPSNSRRLSNSDSITFRKYLNLYDSCSVYLSVHNVNIVYISIEHNVEVRWLCNKETNWLTTYRRFHISDHSRSTWVHSATTGSVFDRSFKWIYDLGKMPMIRGFLGHVPRNHGPFSSRISTESPTSSSRPCRTPPFQLWMSDA